MTEIGYACVVARKFTNETSVSFQLNFPLHCSADQINAELDRLGDILERQQVRIDVPTLERQIENQKAQLAQTAESIKDLKIKIDDADKDKDRRNGATPNMKETYNTSLKSYEQQREQIMRAEGYLDELRKKAA